MTAGGYDDGYGACRCFWGRRPGSLLRPLLQQLGKIKGLRVLDAGCGEGKNAAFLAAEGAVVRAIDVSDLALQNARHNWPAIPQATWERGDIREVELPAEGYDVVIAYGVLHCLASEDEVLMVVERLMNATRPSGFHVVCAFNNRHQELQAHPGFSPVLLPHAVYLSLYEHWAIISASDEDLRESHPHNNVPHTHSMTRLIARKVIR